MLRDSTSLPSLRQHHFCAMLTDMNYIPFQSGAFSASLSNRKDIIRRFLDQLPEDELRGILDAIATLDYEVHVSLAGRRNVNG